MKKTKFALVSLLSLLVVLAPVSTAIAQAEPAKGAAEKRDKVNKNREKGSNKAVFEKIEDEGGKDVSNKELARKEGEGPFGAMVGAIAGAVVGLGTSLANGIVNHHGAARMARDVVVTTMTCGAAGATIGGMASGPA